MKGGVKGWVMNIESIKIVVTGGINVGKKCFIGAIAESVYPHIPVPPSGPFRRNNDGQIAITNDISIFLMSTFSFSLPWHSWAGEILAEEMKAFCVLIDSTNPRSIYEALAILKYLTLLDVVPHIVVANKQDCEEAMTVGQIRRAMELPDETLILPCVATERVSVVTVLNTLLAMIRPDLAERIT
jgi:uncharacterized protein